MFQLGLSEKPDFLFPTPNFSLSNIFYRAFGISKSPAIEETTPEEREEIAIGRVQGDLSVNLVTNTSLLSITFADQKPKYASDIANQVAQSFIDQRLDQTSETSDLARQFIQEQVLQVKQKLQKSEEELVAYAKDAGITITGDEKSLIGSNIEALNTALATAIQERLDAGRMVDQIDKGRGGEPRPGPGKRRSAEDQREAVGFDQPVSAEAGHIEAWLSGDAAASGADQGIATAL